MKVICFQCGYQRKRYDPTGRMCPQCHRDWRKPALWHRICAAFRTAVAVFITSGKPHGYNPRVFKPKQATIDDFISTERAVAQGTETDLRD